MATAVDIRGKELSIVSAPGRIVSMVPSITEALFAFGAGNRVAGVTRYCIEPREAQTLPKIGGTKTPDIDTILALSPDLVIANREENHAHDIEALEAAGIPVFVTYPVTVRETRTMLAALAGVIGSEESAAPFLAELDAAISNADAARSEDRRRVFCPIWRRPYRAVNRDTYIHDLLTMAGGENVFADRSDRYPEVTFDEIISAAPDVILLPSEPYPFAEKHRQELAQLPVPAAKNGRIHLCSGEDVTWHGIRTAGALRRLTALIAS